MSDDKNKKQPLAKRLKTSPDSSPAKSPTGKQAEEEDDWSGSKGCGPHCIWKAPSNKAERKARETAHELRMKRLDTQGKECARLMAETNLAMVKMEEGLKSFIEKHSGPVPQDGRRYVRSGMAYMWHIDQACRKSPAEMCEYFETTLGEGEAYDMSMFFNVKTDHWWFVSLTGRGEIEPPLVYTIVNYSTPVLVASSDGTTPPSAVTEKQ